LTIRRTYGRLNQTFPIWELGAGLYWRSFDPLHVQTPRGLGTVSYSYVSGAGTLYPYYVFDPGKGHFRQVNPAVAPEFPPDGFLPPSRSDNWNDSQLDARGFTVFETGLTHTHPALTSSHILDPTSTGLTLGLRMVNPTAGDLKIRRSDTTNATLTNCFQVLLHRSDGGIIDGNTASLWAAAAIADPNAGSATTYRKIREDGWYVLDMTLPPVPAAPSYYYGVVIKPGVTVDVEMVSIEGTSATNKIGTFGGPWLSANPTRYVHALTIRRKDAAGVGLEGWHKDGWMATLIIDPNPPGLVRALGVGVNQEDPAFGNLDYARVSMSSTDQNFVSALYMDVGGVATSQIYLNQTAALAAGRIHALVTSWGRHKGDERAYLFDNGKQVDINTGFDIPTIADPTVYQIGFRSASSSAFGQCIQAVAIGRQYLTRDECRRLSIWLKKQALSAWA
jgi:hypothetical protein